jgi:hypothetical protein
MSMDKVNGCPEIVGLLAPALAAEKKADQAACKV